MKGTMVGCLITNHQREIRQVLRVDGERLQSKGAGAQPVEASHVGNQKFVGGGGRRVFFSERVVKDLKVFRIFAGREDFARS